MDSAPSFSLTPVGSEAVVAAAGREVVDRQPVAVAPEEPLEGQHRLRTVPVVAGGHHGLDQGLHQRGRLQRLLVPVVGDRYGVQPEPPLVADQPHVAGLDAALDGVPVQGLEPGPLPLRRGPAGSRPRSGPAAAGRCRSSAPPRTSASRRCACRRTSRADGRRAAGAAPPGRATSSGRPAGPDPSTVKATCRGLVDGRQGRGHGLQQSQAGSRPPVGPGWRRPPRPGPRRPARDGHRGAASSTQRRS